MVKAIFTQIYDWVGIGGLTLPVDRLFLGNSYAILSCLYVKINGKNSRVFCGTMEHYVYCRVEQFLFKGY